MRTLVSVVSFLLTIVSAIKPKTHLRDVYASSGELTSVFKMEQELVDILAKHKAETQDQLAAIKEYKEEVGIYFFLVINMIALRCANHRRLLVLNIFNIK